MSAITTHVLDTALGKPAEGLAISLSQQTDEGWKELASGVTNSDGRIADLLADDFPLKAGIYQMLFQTGPYFESTQTDNFYPFVPIVFELQNPNEHYHVPLLLNPFGYSTYRGS
ncbi:MAG: hydroxyisourate hydrolase [Pirellulales bacterium]